MLHLYKLDTGRCIPKYGNCELCGWLPDYNNNNNNNNNNKNDNNKNNNKYIQ